MPRHAAQHATQDEAALLAEMRARVEAAAGEIDRLTSELTAREEWADELESIVDLALGLLDTPMVVVGDDRRIRALSRGASERLGGDAVVGKPLSSVVADDVFTAVESRLVAAPPGADQTVASAAAATSDESAALTVANVVALPGGGAIVVFEAR
jgi:hypothetical protein